MSAPNRRPIQPLCYDYMVKHAGEVVLLHDLAAATGLTRRQVQQAMWKLVEKDGNGITAQQTGHAWLFQASAARKGQLFELITESKSGKAILEAEDGSTWVATKVMD